MDLHDVRVPEAGHRQRLATEAVDVPLLDRESRAQHLERDRALQLEVARQPHGRHAAAADLAHQLVLAEPAARHRRRVAGRRPGEPGLDHLERALHGGARPVGNAVQPLARIHAAARGDRVGEPGHDAVEVVVERVAGGRASGCGIHAGPGVGPRPIRRGIPGRRHRGPGRWGRGTAAAQASSARR